MNRTRRDFLRESISTGALTTGALSALGLSSLSLQACASTQEGEPVKKKRILILGGTGFLGPALITAVVERGHELTLFNSGSTEERREAAGRDSVIPEGVEVLLGNRDPKLTADDRRLRGKPESEKDPNSPRGLSSLEGHKWDAVIDTSGYFPRMVRASAGMLADQTDQYLFISTISVYTDNGTPNMDETAEVHTLADPDTEEFGSSFENYGGGKADCEKAAEAAMPGRVTNIRPGFIVGPRDTSRRYCYWPWRVAQGGEMLVPGTAEDPVQIIDVRDLAEWCVHCIEQGTTGVFNATGPMPPMNMGQMLAACMEGVGEKVEVTYGDPAMLSEKGLGYPIWISPEGDTAGFHRVNVDRAVKAGLKFRPQADTAQDTLAWMMTLPEETQARLVPGDLMTKEAEVLQELEAKDS